MKKRIVLSFLYFIPFLSAMELDVPVKVKTFSFTTQGKRKTDEDRCITTEIAYDNKKYLCTGIFDGNGGEEVAQMAKEKFFTFFEEGLNQNKLVKKSLQYACQQCEKLAAEEKYQHSGSTVLVSCFDEKMNELSLLWLGDSKGWIAAENCGSFFTSEHNCANEKEKKRVESAEGKFDAYDKLNGIISVTRCLGQAFGKKTTVRQLLSKPEGSTWNIYKKFDDRYFQCCGIFIGGSDGFWGALKNKTETEMEDYVWDAKNLSHKKFYKEYPATAGGDNDLMSDEEEHEINMARRLCYVAVSHLGSKDNTTVIVQLLGEDSWLFVNSSDDSDESGDDSGEGDSETSSDSEIKIDSNVLAQSLAALNTFKPGAEQNTQNGDGSVALPEQKEEHILEKKEQLQEMPQSTDQKAERNNEGQEQVKELVGADTGCQKYRNYALMVGGGLGLLAFIYALFHYNCISLNFVLG